MPNDINFNERNYISFECPDWFFNRVLVLSEKYDMSFIDVVKSLILIGMVTFREDFKEVYENEL